MLVVAEQLPYPPLELPSSVKARHTRARGSDPTSYAVETTIAGVVPYAAAADGRGSLGQRRAPAGGYDTGLLPSCPGPPAAAGFRLSCPDAALTTSQLTLLLHDGVEIHAPLALAQLLEQHRQLMASPLGQAQGLISILALGDLPGSRADTCQQANFTYRDWTLTVQSHRSPGDGIGSPKAVKRPRRDTHTS